MGTWLDFKELPSFQSLISVASLWLFCLNAEPHAALLSFSRPFPTEESPKDEDIYNNLEDLIEYVWGFSLRVCHGRWWNTITLLANRKPAPSPVLFGGPDTHMFWLGPGLVSLLLSVGANE